MANTVQLLKEKRRFHQEQLQLVDLALAAIESSKKDGLPTGVKNGRSVNKVKKHRIRWTKEIEQILDDYDQFTIMDIQNDLAENRDIASASTIQGRNVINNTLGRFEKKGRVQKIRPGVYMVIKTSLSSGT